MKNLSELDQLGKQISEGFVHDGVSLNEGLKKVANDSVLNREQLQRVAEAANTETYLSLMKTAKENYVDFDLADFKEVHDSMTKTASSEIVEVDDYDLEYEEVVNTNTDDGLEKIASIEKTAAAAKNEAIEARETMKYLDEAAYETLINIDNGYFDIEKIAKQLILQDVPLKNVTTVVKTASEYISDPISELLTTRLKEYAPHIDLTKEASIEGVPNTDSELYQAASNLQEEVAKYLKIENAIDHYHEKYANLITDYDLPLVKEAGDVSKILFHSARLVGRTAKGLVRGAKKFPIMATGAVLYTIGRKTGKQKGKREQGKVLSRRAVYRKNKPKILKSI